MAGHGGGSANWKIPSGGEDTPPNACSVRVVGASTTVDRTLILSALSLEDGAALTVPDSIALHADVLLHEGEKVADGVYTGSGNEGTSVAWLSGPGVLTVGAVAASAAVWTGAGGDPKASTVGNWNDPAVRLYDGSLLATFATGGTEALLDNDMVWRGLVFDTAAFAFAESNRRLIVGAGGLLSADAAAARTFSMNVPVELAAAQVWTIGTNTTVNLNKTLTGAGAAVLSVKGAGTLNLSAANHLPGETTFNGNDSNKRLTLNVKDPDALGGPEGSTKVNQMTTALTFTQPGTVRRPISVYCPTNDKDRDVVGPTSGTLVFQEKYTTTQSNSRLAVYGGSTIVFEQPVTTASAWYINKWGSSTAEGRVVCNARLKVGDRLQVPAGVTLELNATTNQINGNSGNVNGTIKCNVPYALWKTTTATSTRGTAVYPYSGTLDLNGYDQAVGILTAKGNTSAGRVTSATLAVLHLVDDYTVDSYDSWVYASDGKTKIAVPGVTNRVAFTGGASLSKEGKYETCLYVASSTTGSLAVVKGDLRMAPVASWRNASAVYVRGGRLVIEKRAVAQGEPFGKKVTDIEVMGGVVDIAEGQVVFCRNLTVDGTTYRMFGYTVGSSQSDAEIKDDIHFSGKGKIKVYGEGPGFMIYLR